MNRFNYANELIESILKRNLFLESKLFNIDKVEANITSDKIVFVLKECESKRIAGVFFDEKEALICESEMLPVVCEIESWVINRPEEEPADFVPIPIGTQVTVRCDERTIQGSIIRTDSDTSMGIEKVLYHILPEGLPNQKSNYTIVFQSEIISIGFEEC